MGTLYSRRGSAYYVTSSQDQDLSDTLPVATLVVDWDPKAGEFLLRLVDDFPLPSRIYGGLEAKADRIIGTFQDRASSTGALLVGAKGGGKSLLAKVISRRAAALGVPTILVNTPYGGDRFNRFVQSIHQPAVFLFDEFEKVYPPASPDRVGEPDDDEPQAAAAPKVTQDILLTLLDGTFPTRKLFVLTCNDRYKIDRNLLNRPGRLFYFLEFGPVTEDFVTEYCRDNLADRSHLAALHQLAAVLGGFNFDQLQAVVEEMNRYHEPPDAAVEMLNVRPERSSAYFSVHLERAADNRSVGVASHNETVYANPYREAVKLHLTDGAPAGGKKVVTFQPADMTLADPLAGRYVYRADGLVLTLTEAVRRDLSLRLLMG